MGHRKLTTDDIDAIVRRYPAGEPVADIARDYGITPDYVRNLAHARGVRRHRTGPDVWQPEWDALLGTKPDGELAMDLRLPVWRVSSRRIALHIPDSRQARKRAVLDRLRALPDSAFGTKPDTVLAAEHGTTPTLIGAERRRRGVTAAPRLGIAQLPSGAAWQGLMRRAAVAGMIAAVGPDAPGLQSEVARIMGWTRERSRQVCNEVRAALVPLLADEAERGAA